MRLGTLTLPRTTLVIASLVFIVACQRHAAVTHTPHAAFATNSLAEEDVGVSLLAGVDNARLAIAQANRLDAANDVADARTFAAQLAGQSSHLFADAPSLGAPSIEASPRADGHPSRRPAPAGHAPMTRFEAQVKLETAGAALARGDLATADASLAAIHSGVASASAPINLPLLEADESLDVALGALSGERPANLRYQLANAVRALRAYRGAANAAEAKALADEIDAALSQPSGESRVSPAQVGLWSDRIDGWI